ncbi:MAG: hypothetical protein H0T14_00540 [Nocardioidaceae bacterium]|nr:hypothetical protein [Nocardioidaceae bacterium]
MPNPATTAAGREIERFAAPAGRWLGFAVMGLGAVLVVVGFVGSTVIERNVGLAGTAAALVSWVVLVRPVAAICEHGVLLRNMARDIFVPASKIERCRVFQTLQVVTDQRHFHGLGVTRSARSMLREQRGPRLGVGFMGIGGAGAVPTPGHDDTMHRLANEELTGSTYPEYVESRIMAMADAAKPDDRQPVSSWDVLPVGALGLAAAVIAVAFAWS